MQEIFEYPLDTSYLLRKKRSLKRQLASKNHLLSKKIAILGGSTTAEIKDMLELFLLNEGIEAIFYESAYNHFYEEVMFESNLRDFAPDIIYIHTSYRNLRHLPQLDDEPQQVDSKLELEFNFYKNLWEKALADNNCIVIQNNFEYPRNRSLGNMDSTASAGLTYYINRLNLKLSEFAQTHNKVVINDIQYLSSWLGLDKWHDHSFWYNFKYALSYQCIPYLAKNVANIIKSIFGLSKKCLVLDLDNTLWGGVIGDDGIQNIKLGQETGIGQAFLDLQQYIKALHDRGVLLSIASKNDYKNAIEGLGHPDMILKEEYFTCIEANWEHKHINIQNIVQKINIGIESLVFLDDNPSERDLVRTQLPTVSIPNIGDDVSKFIDFIDRNGYFETTNISWEDKSRNKFYSSNMHRRQLSDKYTDYNEFLRSLNMIAEIASFKPIYYERIAQLTNKTNQFNLTTRRYSLSEIESISCSSDKITLYGRLKDIYGDNGLVSVIVGAIKDYSLHIDLWLMSCRVFKRGMEYAMFDALVEECRMNGINHIYGTFIRTAKNQIVQTLYEELGFKLFEENEEVSHWVLDLNDVEYKKNHIIVRGVY